MEVEQGLRERHVGTARPQHPGCSGDLHAEADEVARDRWALDARHIHDNFWPGGAGKRQTRKKFYVDKAFPLRHAQQRAESMGPRCNEHPGYL